MSSIILAFGNIVCFRNLEQATNESIALFGDKEAGGIVLLKTFDEYYKRTCICSKCKRVFAGFLYSNANIIETSEILYFNTFAVIQKNAS